MPKNQLLLITLVVALISVLSFSFPSNVHAASSTDDWPMFHHDPAHTGYSNSSVPTTTPVVMWNSSRSGGSPVIVNGYLVTGGYTVGCFNASSGNQLWTQRLPSSAGDSTI